MSITDRPAVPPPLRPADLCRELLAALDAAEGRRTRRKRDTTPDRIGHEIKRELLEAAIAADPGPDTFEAWLLQQALDSADRPAGTGGVRAMAVDILQEWRLAQASREFRAWLAGGAPSDDKP